MEGIKNNANLFLFNLVIKLFLNSNTILQFSYVSKLACEYTQRKIYLDTNAKNITPSVNVIFFRGGKLTMEARNWTKGFWYTPLYYQLISGTVVFNKIYLKFYRGSKKKLVISGCWTAITWKRKVHFIHNFFLLIVLMPEIFKYFAKFLIHSF